jgi:hypothetical protein
MYSYRYEKRIKYYGHTSSSSAIEDQQGNTNGFGFFLTHLFNVRLT